MKVKRRVEINDNQQSDDQLLQEGKFFTIDELKLLYEKLMEHLTNLVDGEEEYEKEVSH